MSESQTADATKASAESKDSSDGITYNIGDYVELQGSKKKTRKGYIRFKGKIEAFGECVGIELDEKINDGNNGKFNEEQYFECDDGKGTFIKTAKIIKKLAIETTSTIKETEDNESFPANPAIIEKSEAAQLKKSDKKKKKKKKNTTKKGKKGTAKDSKKSAKNLKPSIASKRASNGKRNSASLKKPKKTAKKEIDFNIPSTGSNKDKLKFIFSRLNSVKTPFKKRIEIMNKSIKIIEDEKSDDLTAKYGVDSYKKCFVTQLTDRKKGVHLSALSLLKSMINNQIKAFKPQTAHYLKHLMEFIEKKSEPKALESAESVISLICTKCTVKDNKTLGIIMASLMRFGTTAKNKTTRKNGWKYIALILKKYEPKKTDKNKKKKPPKTVLDALQTGLKQGLGDNDKATQKESMNVLISMSLIDEARAERLMARMSPAQKRNFDKLSGNIHTKTKSTAMIDYDNIKKGVKVKKKTKSNKNIKVPKPKPKRPKSPKPPKSVDKKKNKPDKKIKKKEIKKKIDKKKTEKTSTKDKTKEKKDDDDKKVEDVTVIATATATEPTESVEDKTKTDKEEDRDKVETAKEEETVKKVETEEVVKAREEEETKKEKIVESVDPAYITKTGEENEEEEGDGSDEEEEESDEESEGSDDSSSSSSGANMIGSGSTSTENDARDLIESFLDLKDPQINWKMIEFLSKDNMTHLLMSYISRMPQGPKIWQMELDVDLSSPIPSTKPLSSDLEEEQRATQLSYSLMRILSNEHCAETVKSFLLRKCQEICLHALAVFHPSSSGNVYHGRVVLEILLNHWPKSFMASLTNQRHIESLLKCALFRNLHQGNLNSFFLDLICFQQGQQQQGIEPVKSKLISMFVSWKFIEYLLSVSTSSLYIFNGDDSVATKYATFFIDCIARCASISEAQPLFGGTQYLIIDSFMNGLLNKSLTIWHRISCGQTLVQFLDISSRPTIMDPASAMAGMLGVVAPDPMTNILHPMFDEALNRLHSFIPRMCALITSSDESLSPIKLASGIIQRPFGQIRLNCLELLTVSADFAQFKCGDVLSRLSQSFWSQLLNIAFIHCENNMYLCHFRRLIHLSMIFRRRFLKHLFLNDKLLERFVDFYQTAQPRTTLHGYILQMLWDIYNHDQRDEEHNAEHEKSDSIVVTEKEEEEEDVVLKPNFSKEKEDQWDIVQYFNNNVVWKSFIVTVSIQMEAQNATEMKVPNMNVANNQQQLDQLLENLLGPNNEDNDSETDSDEDSDDD